MRVCGLSARDRAMFLATVLQFGPPYVHHNTEQGWVPFTQQFPDHKRVQVRCLMLSVVLSEQCW